MNIWFTADQHYGHKNIIKYEYRPFDTTEGMDDFLIECHNSVVKPGDIVYHGGDFGFGKEDYLKGILERLNGKHFISLGNHDKKKAKMLNIGFAYAEKSYADITPDGHHFHLSHYPPKNVWLPQSSTVYLFGHVHSKFEGSENVPNSQNIGVDVTDYYPVNMRWIKDRIRNRLNDKQKH